MGSAWQDVRYAIRTAARQPGFTAAVVLTLALGVGASTAIFSICYTVLFRPLRYPDPDRLVMLWERTLRDGRLGPAAPANFVDWRRENRSFEDLAALNPFLDMTVARTGGADHVAAAAVSAGFFSLLGTPLASGRDFLPDEDRAGGNRVVILSDAFWRRHFGSDPAVLDRQLLLNGATYTVVGVLPRAFQFVGKASDFQGRNRFDLWVPLGLNPQRLQRGTHPLRVFGRLKPGVTVTQAQADLDVLARNLERAHPANRDRGIAVVSLRDHVVSNVRTALLALLAAVGSLLLIACVNVANLLLGRAATREQEIAVRLALGASRFRLGRQFFAESAVLASAGGVAGIGVAWAALRVLMMQVPYDLPRADSIRIDWVTLGFSAAISIVTGLLFGCVPLMHQMRAHDCLKRGSHTVTSSDTRARSALVVTQVALACVLLIGAGLTGRSLWRLLQVSPGFRTENLLTGMFQASSPRYGDVRRIASLQRDLLDRVRRLPGVRSAAFAAYLPLGGTDNAWSPAFEGRPPLPSGEYIKYRPVTAGYFETLAIPLQDGRLFADSDSEDAPAVVIINAAAARAYWPEGRPVGQRLQIDGPPWRTVVGVVGDVRHEGLQVEGKPELYLPFAQLPYPDRVMTLIVRTIGEPLNLASEVQHVLTTVDLGLPLYRVETMDRIVDASVGQPRFRATLLAAFAVAAVMLASIGLYGVMSYLVSQRAREFGIRTAVGATRNDLMRLVLGRSLAMVLGGLVLGLAGAVGVEHFVRSLLYGLSAHDVWTFSTVPLLLLVVGLLASYLPARRAASIDPAKTLRSE
jgi:putative ABC transport system permease protein